MSRRPSPGDTSERHVSSGDTTSIQRELPATGVRPGAPVCVSLTDGRVRVIDGAVRIGRDETCELALLDRSASRTHALLEARTSGAIAITDQHSRNGTFVDGRRVAVTEVTGPVIVRAGESVFRIVHMVDEPVSATITPPLVGGTSLVPLRRTLGLVGPTNLPVLVLGETGTGKEVVAHEVHAASQRTGAFVAVNCAALPAHLIESELFGHARGAFTGAAGTRRGLFAEAEGGTLFLDEVGELPLDVQAKLLRVLETKAVRQVGSDREVTLDVRIVSATNRDLHAGAARGEFRPDLLARLAGVELMLPPLRERVEDLGVLVPYLWRRAHGTTPQIDADALEAMALYDWPLNIRELDHALRAAAIANPRVIELDALPARIAAGLRTRRVEVAAPAAVSPVRAETLYDQRDTIERALREHRGNVQQVARSIGMARGHLYRALRRWNLDPAVFRAPTEPPHDPEASR